MGLDLSIYNLAIPGYTYVERVSINGYSYVPNQVDPDYCVGTHTGYFYILSHWDFDPVYYGEPKDLVLSKTRFWYVW